jgi:integrase
MAMLTVLLAVFASWLLGLVFRHALGNAAACRLPDSSTSAYGGPGNFAETWFGRCSRGARAGEALAMTTADIDQSAADGVWAYRPAKHKNAYRGHTRNIVLGPRAQLILRRYLKPGAPEDRLFKPGTVRPGGKIEHRDQYSVCDYDKAIGRACVKAGVPHWSSHQLRHLAAHLAEQEVSLEGARHYLGHKTANMSAHYAGVNVEAAAEVARRIG